MNKALVAAAILGALSTAGCKKSVPSDIVQKSVKNAIRQAPLTSSAMCGTSVHGLANATISVKTRGENNTGVAHIKGFPMSGGVGAPASCEGDVEYAFTYTSKTRGYKKKTTTTTWYLEKLKLVAVQTKGVTLKSVEEVANDEDEGAP